MKSISGCATSATGLPSALALAPTVELPELKALQHLQRLNGPQAIGAYARAQIGLGNRFEAEQSVAIRRVYETLPREWQGLAATMSLGPIPSRSPHDYATRETQTDDPWKLLLASKEFLRNGNTHLGLLAIRRSLALGLDDPAEQLYGLGLYAISCQRIGLSHSYKAIKQEISQLVNVEP